MVSYLQGCLEGSENQKATTESGRTRAIERYFYFQSLYVGKHKEKAEIERFPILAPLSVIFVIILHPDPTGQYKRPL